ncbi:MAG: AAA family ATPase [Hydrococcus sp. RM1_1_31]|nr:AAA family ATPase [Hydrococcus sp. RM1_1_31]
MEKTVKSSIDVIPELECILGTQPTVPELSGNAAQNRFNLLFGNFVRIFTTPEHPLVIFLDDLQWADLASLNLLKVLMSDSDAGYLLVLGAYRDNEVFPAHPLMLTLAELKKTQAIISTITLQSLTLHHINQWVAETLSCAQSLAQPLTKLIYQKTQGNPFFTTQLLQGLHENQLITFNRDLGYWECDLVKIYNATLTDDVVEFMAKRLQKLSEATQKVLKLASCIGNQFELENLSVICEAPQEEIALHIWEALQEGLVLPISENYKFFQERQISDEQINVEPVNYRFLHDRVQQAAYFLIPDDQKQITHYRIGQLLLHKIPLEDQENRIFDLVGQLNYGVSLIKEQKERDKLAQFNLIACQKARNSTAYQAGREYAATGLSLLGNNAWQQQYKSSLSLHNIAAELALLCGDFEGMQQLIETIIAKAHSLPEKVNAYRFKILSNTSQNQLAEAIITAQHFLQQLGVILPEAPTEKDIQQAVSEINELLKNRKIEYLINQFIMTDQKKNCYCSNCQ